MPPYPLTLTEQLLSALISLPVFIALVYGFLALVPDDPDRPFKRPSDLASPVERFAARCGPELYVIWVPIWVLWFADRTLEETGSPWWDAFYILAAVGWLTVAVGILLMWRLHTKRSGLFFEPQQIFGALYGAARDVYFITFIFVIATILLIQAHVVHLAHAEPNGARVWTATTYYFWHLLDEIPTLDIPETIGWKVNPSVTGFAARLILLLFKLAVILPAVALARHAWRFRQTSTSQVSETGDD